MDHDQEVVREPFEDNDSVFSSEHSGEDAGHGEGEYRLRNSQTRNSADRALIDRYELPIHSSSPGHNEDNEGDKDEDADPSSHEEDAEFAKKYGIELKTKRTKRELAYKKLLISGQLDAKQNRTHQNGATNMLKTSVTSDCIYHKGTFYQKGDIVALRDQDDGQVYFSQLTGFLQDQYCEKSASVTWLVPTRTTSREFFDPSAYRIGLEDPQLRKLDCVTFVRHCPHDYYLRKLFQASSSTSVQNLDQPLLKSTSNKDKYYIWTTMEPCLVPPIVSD